MHPLIASDPQAAAAEILDKMPSAHPKSFHDLLHNSDEIQGISLMTAPAHYFCEQRATRSSRNKCNQRIAPLTMHPMPAVGPHMYPMPAVGPRMHPMPAVGPQAVAEPEVCWLNPRPPATSRRRGLRTAVAALMHKLCNHNWRQSNNLPKPYPQSFSTEASESFITQTSQHKPCCVTMT